MFDCIEVTTDKAFIIPILWNGAIIALKMVHKITEKIGGKKNN